MPASPISAERIGLPSAVGSRPTKSRARTCCRALPESLRRPRHRPPRTRRESIASRSCRGSSPSASSSSPGRSPTSNATCAQRGSRWTTFRCRGAARRPRTPRVSQSTSLPPTGTRARSSCSLIRRAWWTCWSSWSSYPHAAKRIAAIVAVAGAANGTPLADDRACDLP